MATNKKTVGKTTTETNRKEEVNMSQQLEQTIVRPTAKSKVNYIPKGVAKVKTDSKGTKRVFIYMMDGTRLVIGKPVSDKQAKMYKCKTAKNYNNDNDLYDIFASNFIIDLIDKSIDYSQQDDQPTTKELTTGDKLHQQVDTQKKADIKTHKLINKELKQEEIAKETN